MLVVGYVVVVVVFVVCILLFVVCIFLCLMVDKLKILCDFFDCCSYVLKWF